MIPRGTPDLGWADLVSGLLSCLWPADPSQARARVEARWSGTHDSLACLSVRSGFDVLLQALAWPPGTEVLVSAVTIRDMLRILEHHGLVPIPLDITPDTLALDAEQVARAVTPRTRALLVAHLFGSRMPLDPVLRVAQKHRLFVIEDCAQAYDASAYRGDPGSDVSMFSFGPIKTSTALGGALLRFKDPALLANVRQRQTHYPFQRRRTFVRRLALFAVLKLLAHPLPLLLFVAVCRVRKLDHDHVLSRAVRGFSGANLMPRIRQQPCAPLLQLLERRLMNADPAQIERRVAFVERVIAALPLTHRPGTHAGGHTHWVLPIESVAPESLVRLLWAYGFDATRHASSLTVALPAERHAEFWPANAARMMDRLVYLPMYPDLTEHDLDCMGSIITDFEAARADREHQLVDV